jgi:hypothetical protein
MYSGGIGFKNVCMYVWVSCRRWITRELSHRAYLMRERLAAVPCVITPGSRFATLANLSRPLQQGGQGNAPPPLTTGAVAALIGALAARPDLVPDLIVALGSAQLAARDGRQLAIMDTVIQCIETAVEAWLHMAGAFRLEDIEIEVTGHIVGGDQTEGTAAAVDRGWKAGDVFFRLLRDCLSLRMRTPDHSPGPGDDVQWSTTTDADRNTSAATQVPFGMYVAIGPAAQPTMALGQFTPFAAASLRPNAQFEHCFVPWLYAMGRGGRFVEACQYAGELILELGRNAGQPTNACDLPFGANRDPDAEFECIRRTYGPALENSLRNWAGFITRPADMQEASRRVKRLIRALRGHAPLLEGHAVAVIPPAPERPARVVGPAPDDVPTVHSMTPDSERSRTIGVDMLAELGTRAVQQQVRAGGTFGKDDVENARYFVQTIGFPVKGYLASNGIEWAPVDGERPRTLPHALVAAREGFIRFLTKEALLHICGTGAHGCAGEAVEFECRQFVLDLLTGRNTLAQITHILGGWEGEGKRGSGAHYGVSPDHPLFKEAAQRACVTYERLCITAFCTVMGSPLLEDRTLGISSRRLTSFWERIQAFPPRRICAEFDYRLSLVGGQLDEMRSAVIGTLIRPLHVAGAFASDIAAFHGPNLRADIAAAKAAEAAREAAETIDQLSANNATLLVAADGTPPKTGPHIELVMRGFFQHTTDEHDATPAPFVRVGCRLAFSQSALLDTLGREGARQITTDAIAVTALARWSMASPEAPHELWGHMPPLPGTRRIPCPWATLLVEGCQRHRFGMCQRCANTDAWLPVSDDIIYEIRGASSLGQRERMVRP